MVLPKLALTMLACFQLKMVTGLLRFRTDTHKRYRQKETLQRASVHSQNAQESMQGSWREAGHLEDVSR